MASNSNKCLSAIIRDKCLFRTVSYVHGKTSRKNIYNIPSYALNSLMVVNDFNLYFFHRLYTCQIWQSTCRSRLASFLRWFVAVSRLAIESVGTEVVIYVIYLLYRVANSSELKYSRIISLVRQVVSIMIRGNRTEPGGDPRLPAGCCKTFPLRPERKPA